MDNTSEWVTHEEKWVKPKRAKYCNGCHRTWPSHTQMYLIRGRGHSETGIPLTPQQYIWLCPVCCEFIASVFRPEQLAGVVGSTLTISDEPWWRAYRNHYLKVENGCCIPVIVAGLDRAADLIEKDG